MHKIQTERPYTVYHVHVDVEFSIQKFSNYVI